MLLWNNQSCVSFMTILYKKNNKNSMAQQFKKFVVSLIR